MKLLFREQSLMQLQRFIRQYIDRKPIIFQISHTKSIKTADWLIDLGPEGGDKGGQVVAVGTPEDVVKIKGSYIGPIFCIKYRQKSSGVL